MEIHIRNIAFACDVHTLARRLAEVLHQPPYTNFTVTPANFDIRLFRRRNGDGHGGTGLLTLPTVDLAHEFMADYGEDESEEAREQFYVMDRRVFFTWSRSANNPQPDIVERINRLPYKDPRALEEKLQKARELSAGVVPISAVQFGWECRDKVFSIEWERRAMPLGPGEMASGAINVYFSPADRELRVTIFLDRDPLGAEFLLDDPDVVNQSEYRLSVFL